MIHHMLANDEDIERLLYIMANLPEFLRLSLARRKVKELISMAESERLESISRAFSCTTLIESNKMVELLGSWIRAMCEVESSVLTQLMVTYCKALLNQKNFICKYSEKVLNAYFLLQKEDQEKIMICLKEAIFLGPHPGKSIKILPQKLKNAMQISI
jgi:hypothetical protein